MLENGWELESEQEDEGPVEGLRFLHELYTHVKGDYTCVTASASGFARLCSPTRCVYSGRVTVPVLYDAKTNTIVNNESSEIIRIFNSAFNGSYY